LNTNFRLVLESPTPVLMKLDSKFNSLRHAWRSWDFWSLRQQCLNLLQERSIQDCQNKV